MDHDLILEFTKEMFTMKQFEQVSHHCKSSSSAHQFSTTPTDATVVPQLFLPSLLRFVAGLLGCGDLASRNVCLDVLVRLILAKAPPPTDGSMAFETYPLLFTGQTTGSDRADFPSFDPLKSLDLDVTRLC